MRCVFHWPRSCPVGSTPPTHRSDLCDDTPSLPVSLLFSPTCAPWLSSQSSSQGRLLGTPTLGQPYFLLMVFCLYIKDFYIKILTSHTLDYSKRSYRSSANCGDKIKQNYDVRSSQRPLKHCHFIFHRID